MNSKNQTIIGTSESSTVIKGGHYVAPNVPAEPIVSDSLPWGTAMSSLATPYPTSQSETIRPPASPATEK